MSTKTVPAGKWKLRPFDPNCKTFVDPDPMVEDQIRCKVPAWTGDFGELIPELIAQGLRLDELPRLTVRDIGQFVIRAAQGGSLQYGPVGTAVGTIIASPAADDGFYTWAADSLDDLHWKILTVCASRATDRATAKSAQEIAAYVAGGGGRPARGDVDDMRRKFDLLRKHELLKGEQGVGSWITQKGLALVEARRKKQRQELRVV